MTSPKHVELNENGEPLDRKSEGFTSRNLMKVFAIFFYILTVVLGLYFYDILTISPIVFYTAYVTGPVTSVISSIVAFLTAWLFLGQWDFVKEVFKLYSNTRFIITTSLVFLTIPISMFLSIILDVIAESHLSRKILFILFFILMIAISILAFEMILGFYKEGAYFFGFFILGIIYLVIFVKAIKTAQKAEQQFESTQR